MNKASIMLPVKPFQETLHGSFCGPASLKIVLDYYGVEKSQEVADGHNSVVVGLNKEYIYLQDPEVGRVRKINRDDFFRVWFDFSSDHIEKWEDMIIRQVIVIYKNH